MNMDYTLRQQIMAALDRDTSLSTDAIAVSVRDEVVSLYGRAATSEQAARVERLITLVPGVRALASELEVTAGPDPVEFGDHDLARAIKNDFKKKPYLGFDQIFVRVKDRAVTLEGEVNWRYQVRLAEQRVLSLGGAEEIVNLLRARGELDAETIAESAGRLAG